MNKNTYLDWCLYAVMAIPLVYLGFIYPSLPASIPIHFNFHGPDAYAEKSQSWVFTGLISCINFGVYQFLRHLPSIDPKRTASQSENLIRKIAVTIVVFLSILQLILITAMRGNLLSIEKLLIPVLGIFFSLLGNLMLNVKPNYFVGIRVPWTLENEDNWRKTHRLAGKLWFTGGLLIALLGIVLPYASAFISLITICVVITLVPVIFSYLYFKKNSV